MSVEIPVRCRQAMATGSSFHVVCRATVHDRAFGMRVVRPPHERRDPGEIPTGNGHRVFLEGHMNLTPYVLARSERIGPPFVESEQLRHARLVISWAILIPRADPPVSPLSDAERPRLVHRRHR